MNNLAEYNENINLCPNSPSNQDDPKNDDQGMNNNNSQSLAQKLPGHQGEKTGGVNINFRVLYCSNIDFSIGYREMYALVKRYGEVQRIRMKLNGDGESYDSYVVFSSATAASLAYSQLNGHSVNDSVLVTRLFNICNFQEDPLDYVPKEFKVREIVHKREEPPLVWFVAKYKLGQENYATGLDTLEETMGGIPEGNVKRYGNSILVKAANSSQAGLLKKFRPLEDDSIEAIHPHRTFNSMRGIIHSKDFYQMSENEIIR